MPPEHVMGTRSSADKIPGIFEGIIGVVIGQERFDPLHSHDRLVPPSLKLSAMAWSCPEGHWVSRLKHTTGILLGYE